jgi:hypothetical protein
MAEPRTTSQKLQIKPGYVIRLVGADAALASLIEPLPDGATVSVSESPDAALVFVRDAADLRERLFTELDGLKAARSVWIAYPKGNVTDMNRDTIMTQSEHVGWQTIGNVALDADWSAVRIRADE